MAACQYMMSVDDVAKELDCSKSHAYKLVKAMKLAMQGTSRWQDVFRKLIGHRRCMAIKRQKINKRGDGYGLQGKRYEKMVSAVV